MLQIEQKVTELRSRLARKRQLNAQQMNSSGNASSTVSSVYLRTSALSTKNTLNGACGQQQRGQATETDSSRAFNPKTVLRSSIGGGNLPNTTYKVPYAKPNNVNANANSNSNSSQLSPNIATVEPLQRLKQQQQQQQPQGTMLKVCKFTLFSTI